MPCGYNIIHERDRRTTDDNNKDGADAQRRALKIGWLSRETNTSFCRVAEYDNGVCIRTCICRFASTYCAAAFVYD